MADGTTYTSFSQYVSRYRQCDLNLCQADGFSTQNKRDKSSRLGLKSNTPESKTENPISHFEKQHYKTGSPVNFFYCSGHLKEHLIKEGRCFKCGKQGHRSTDPDAQCQGQSAVPDEQLSLKIESMKRRISYQSDSEN